MEVNKISQQPNFTGKLTVTKYAKDEAGKIIKTTKELATCAKDDKYIRTLCDTYRQSLGLDTKSYRYLYPSEYIAGTFTEIFEAISGEKPATKELAKMLIDTPLGAVSNRKNGVVVYGDIMSHQNGGTTYQLDLNA